MLNRSRVGISGLLLIFLAACSNGGSTNSTTLASTTPVTDAVASTGGPQTTVAAVPGYSADITRTEYGIPHIVAGDFGILGFGQGYAYSQDRACTLLDQIVRARGERAMWFGPGEDDANIDSDFAYHHLGLWRDADTRFADQPERVVDLVTGYVAGFNAALATAGASGWCAGEAWVRPITTTDLYANLNDVTLYASGGTLIDQIATAQPPDVSPVDPSTLDSAVSDSTPAPAGRVGSR